MIKNRDRLLVEWGTSRLGTPFEFGKCDCVMLLREALKIMGCDAAALPKWNSKRSALKAWRKTGGALAQLKKLGAAELPINFAQTGDVVVSPGSPFDSAYVVINDKLLGIHSGDKVKLYPLRLIKPAAVCLRFL